MREELRELFKPPCLDPSPQSQYPVKKIAHLVFASQFIEKKPFYTVVIKVILHPIQFYSFGRQMLDTAHAWFDIIPLNSVVINKRVAQIAANLFKKYSVS